MRLALAILAFALAPAAALAQSETDARTVALIEGLEEVGCVLPEDRVQSFVRQTDFTRDELDFVFGELERSGVIVREGRLGVAQVNTVPCGGDVEVPRGLVPEEDAELDGPDEAGDASAQD